MIKKIFSNKKMLVLIGVFAGIILSVVTVKGLAYTDSSEFCSSCHIMTQAHDSFADSVHADLACAECHLPQDSVVSKYVSKTKTGLGHLYYNTFGEGKIPEILHATENTQDIVNQNCIDCHESTLGTVSHDAKDSCSDCHSGVPHGSDFKTEDYFKPAKPGELLNTEGGIIGNG